MSVPHHNCVHPPTTHVPADAFKPSSCTGLATPSSLRTRTGRRLVLLPAPLSCVLRLLQLALTPTPSGFWVTSTSHHSQRWTGCLSVLPLLLPTQPPTPCSLATCPRTWMHSDTATRMLSPSLCTVDHPALPPPVFWLVWTDSTSQPRMQPTCMLLRFCLVPTVITIPFSFISYQPCPSSPVVRAVALSHTD